MSQNGEQERVHIRKTLGRFWTVANVLSLFRLLLVLPITLLILQDGSLSTIFVLVLVGIITDYFDGRVARWSNTVSDWGKVLDPLADKAAAVLITLALAVRGILPLWFLSLVILREALIVAGGIVLARRTAHIAMSLWWGKIAVASLSLTIVAALLRADAPVLRVLVLATTALLLVSFLLYVRRFAWLLRYRAAPDRVASQAAERSKETEPLP